MGYVLVTPPVEEPLTRPEAKAHLRVDFDDDDTDIDSLIVDVRQYFERETRRALINQTWRATFNGFPRHEGAIRIAKGPVSAISSVKYYDDANVLQTLDPALYSADLTGEIAEIWPAPDECWPTTWSRWLRRPRHDAVTVEFVAGYGAAAAVPGVLKRGMKLLLGHWYLNREVTIAGQFAEAPLAVKSIIESHQIPLLG